MKSILKKQIILKLAKPNQIKCYTANKPNVIRFEGRANDVLSDKDIISMFLAFVNLIKKNTLLKYEIMYKNKTRMLMEKLDACMSELKDKEQIIKSMTIKQNLDAK